ncbi:MAG: hypothetical protein AB8H03_12385 [Saprospiraceae bacterium]
MQKSKLIQYLSLFSKQELRNFKDFVDSPYFNKHGKTKELLDQILTIKSWDSPQLQKELIFKKVFSNQPFEEQLLRTLMSYLVQLIYRFYSQKEQDSKPDIQQIGRLKMALQNGQKKMFEHNSKIWKKTFSASTIRDSNYFLQESRFQRLLDNFDIKYGKRISGDFLEQALSNFDTFYIGEKLRITCEMLARKQVMGQHYSFSLTHELITFLEKEKSHFESISGVWVYFLIYKMMTENRREDFFELKKRLEKDAPFFKHQEGRDLYTHALNYCIGKINFGENAFRKETFELYQQMLTNGLLYVEEVLPQWDYTNIVSLGCDLQEKEWTKDFILAQKKYLPKAEQENTFTYNLAAFHYSQMEYSSAIGLLQKVEFTEGYYNLLTRILMLKIYFETKDWQALEYFLETFRVYLLRNKKLEGSRIKSGLNLVKYTRTLFRLINSTNEISKKQFREKMELLMSQIEINQKVLNKSWLILKIKKEL